MPGETTLANPARPPSEVSPKSRRVALVGPLPPFRGGIAQHTNQLRVALGKRSELLAVSFTRQYPAFLFPGESDREPEGRRLAEANCRYLIDSLNPLTWRAAFEAIRGHSPEIVIIAWWTVFWAPCFWYLAWRCRRADMEVRFLCHNVADHEAAAWKTALTKAILGQAGSFVVQSRQEQQALEALCPGALVQVHPHPLYDQFPDASAAASPRADLELLFYGFVRPYKGLDTLVEALGLVRNKALRLTVAGEFWAGLDDIRRRIDSLGLADRVELIPRYVSAEETADYFARADALVLPYRSGTGSGVLAIAYHYGKPVIATEIGAFRDIVRQRETGFLVPPESPEALARVIDDLTRETAAAMAPAIRDFARTMTWDSLALSLLGD